MCVESVCSLKEVYNMNLGLNPVGQNTRASVNFGMAIKIGSDAHAIIKRQAMALTDKAYDSFCDAFDAAVKRQENNPVNIIIRKCNNRQALAAEIVDNSENAIDNIVISQGLIHPKGLKFLDKAEAKANKINNLNQRLTNYEAAKAVDYGSKIKINIEG